MSLFLMKTFLSDPKPLNASVWVSFVLELQNFESNSAGLNGFSCFNKLNYSSNLSNMICFQEGNTNKEGRE